MNGRCAKLGWISILACTLGGCTTSGGGTMNQPPTITTQPANQTVMAGQMATFSVMAAGTAPLSYQWQKNNSEISGANSTSYTTTATLASDNGATFRVVVSNSAGTATSNGATLAVSSGAAGTDVTTYKNDLVRTGQNLRETILTTVNVNATKFGLLRKLVVDGKVDAQPLYLSQFSIGGSVHNVVFVATEHDSVYAFDADTGVTLWQAVLTGAGETTSDPRGCGQVTPEIGVTATPVIDRNAGTNGAIYVVAMSKDSSGKYHQRLHALDLSTKAELFGGPKEIQAVFANVGGQTTFDPGQYKERPGLLLLNGVVYLSFSSHCDIGPYTGWVIGYNETTLAQTSVLNIGPNGGGPSIWMSGGAPAADAAGNIYLLAANGAFETTLDANGFPSQGDYGNSFVKIATTGGVLKVADYFAMSNEVSESGGDVDLGSGGAMMLDVTDGGGTVRHLAVGAGKDTNIYVVNRDSMGKFSASGNNIWQEIVGALPGGIWSTPAYFGNTVYFGSVNGPIRAFAIVNAKLGTTPSSQTGTSFTYPGTAPAVSANGNTNGIVWANENTSPAVLHAYDATNLTIELYNSNQAAGGRDQCGNGNKFITPTIADGKVFLGTQNSVCMYGLLP